MVAHPSGAWFRRVRLHWGSKSISRILNFLFLRSIPAARFCTVVSCQPHPCCWQWPISFSTCFPYFHQLYFIKTLQRYDLIFIQTNYFANLFAWQQTIFQICLHFCIQSNKHLGIFENKHLYLQTDKLTSNFTCKHVWIHLILHAKLCGCKIVVLHVCKHANMSDL